MAVALEEKFDEVRQLIVIGKEKGYLLYDEVNDLLPADLTANPEDLEELLAVFSSAGIELVDSEKGYKLEREGIERHDFLNDGNDFDFRFTGFGDYAAAFLDSRAAELRTVGGQ